MRIIKLNLSFFCFVALQAIMLSRNMVQQVNLKQKLKKIIFFPIIMSVFANDSMRLKKFFQNSLELYIFDSEKIVYFTRFNKHISNFHKLIKINFYKFENNRETRQNYSQTIELTNNTVTDSSDMVSTFILK